MNNPHNDIPTGGISPFRMDRNFDQQTNNLGPDISNYNKTERITGCKANSVIRSI